MLTASCTQHAVTDTHCRLTAAVSEHTVNFPLSSSSFTCWWLQTQNNTNGILRYCNCSKIHHITLTVCAPYFVNLNNNTFQLKTLLFFVHLRSQQTEQKSHLQLSNLQCCHFDIVILRVAIIRKCSKCPPSASTQAATDDASTGRWRGSQQTGRANNDTFITSLATLLLFMNTAKM